MPSPTSGVWAHFRIISKSYGKKRVKCVYCATEYKHATGKKLRDHIDRCKKCPKGVQKKFTSSSPSMMQPSKVANNDEITESLSRFIFSAGCKFSIVESEHWQSFISLANPLYCMPTMDVLSNQLLDTEHARIKSNIYEKIRQSTPLSLGLIVDTWTHILGEDVINFTITTSDEPIFFKSTFLELDIDIEKNLEMKIKDMINEVGASKIIAIITDNTKQMKAVWKSVESYYYPHISCIGCVTHTLNLIFKDLFENIDVFKTTLANVFDVVEYMKDDYEDSRLFRDKQYEVYDERLIKRLILFSEERWSEVYDTLESYQKNKSALELTVKSKECTAPKKIKSTVLNCQLWTTVGDILTVLQPLSEATTKSEKASLSDVIKLYENLYKSTTENLNASQLLNDQEKDVILTAIKKEKDACVQPIYYAAYLLDPRYCGKHLSTENISMATEYVSKICDNFACIDKSEVLKNLTEFKEMINFFKESKDMWVAANTLEPRLWWETFASDQSVSKIALNIFSIPPSTWGVSKRFQMILEDTQDIEDMQYRKLVKLLTIRFNQTLYYTDRSEAEEHAKKIRKYEEDCNDSGDSEDDKSC